jgi:excisionase family DNA binding protein
MSQTAPIPEILTLEEAASYLRLSLEAIERNADKGAIPGRRIDGTWRFSKLALDAWLRHHDYRQILVRQTGALSQDENMSDILNQIYKDRGRPEVDDRSE